MYSKLCWFSKCIQNWGGSHIVKANGRIEMPVTSISTTALGRNNNQTQPSNIHTASSKKYAGNCGVNTKVLHFQQKN